MQPQESVQLLEEMGLPESYKCPNCSEIILHKVKHINNITSFRCTGCQFTFKIVNCRICRNKKHNYQLGICYQCFQKAGLDVLESIKDLNRSFQKLIIITSRGKPDLAFSMPSKLYDKIGAFALSKGISRKTLITESVSRYIRSIH